MPKMANEKWLQCCEVGGGGGGGVQWEIEAAGRERIRLVPENCVHNQTELSEVSLTVIEINTFLP